MNTLIEKNVISELKSGENFSYILSNNDLFLATEYKMIKSDKKECLVKAIKMLLNGKIQLFYLTNNYKTLETLLPSLNSEMFITIVMNLFASIIEIKNNGFLNCSNIDISLDKIFVDTDTNKVRLVYLPLNENMFDSYSDFDRALRMNIANAIARYPIVSSKKVIKFCSYLSDGVLSIENLFNMYSLGNEPELVNDSLKKGIIKTMKFTAINAPVPTEFEIDKDEFLIGKKESIVDGVTSFNKLISRLHCKVNREENGFTITDLQSVNGTYINGKRINPNQAYEINDGDIVRLANSDFKITVY